MVALDINQNLTGCINHNFFTIDIDDDLNLIKKRAKDGYGPNIDKNIEIL